MIWKSWASDDSENPQPEGPALSLLEDQPLVYQRRLITLSDNLRAWLAPYASRTGPVWLKAEFTLYHATQKARTNAGLAKWPQNGLRHSFASYHLAKFQDAPANSARFGTCFAPNGL